ncbi:helix-turn-helix transcriptional regulator [Ethanoligenens harbinense]|uniref:Transcriptional regulator, XRE family n=1 Tax=Ethanoligenens harbinense (strain DSM 18485 / JCM 12961 / CGMCC 1.5033 / YUAN-3) TaxID=663278 RepID=E6U6N2_ETHHY|nr:helix-turn-helix transcriptional regulator [Ethanoligenens harbinense]ADU25765.1 transcriptional regulator, XRE family [Ethanoligenens harbinense YUAN-3]AVQ94935.1 transcriptional regulator [Ethanoligenens harbinense YUAN-3]AYF37627.1 transcriptional regulator [Ethanoligenens harbinense]AYF40347.1 transcriptional regulator [Ethanoligenens harbinense]QCN91183.1 transcriptional regulator [Ethanoligenens harbinense]
MENRLRELRRLRGMTQQALADAADISRQTVIAIEAGRFNPSVLLAFRLAKALGVTIEDIFLFER